MSPTTYKFKRQLVDVAKLQNKWKQQGKTYSAPIFSGTNPATTITLHETANEKQGAHAQAHANLQSETGYINAAWHYQGDDKQVIQSWPDTVQGWHAGDGSKSTGGNKTSVAYELCVNKGIDVDKSRDIAARFFAKWLKERGLNEKAVRFHKDWSGKNCPAKILNEGYKDRFVAQVKSYLTGSTTTPTTEGTDMSKKTVNVSGVPVPPGTYEAFKKLAGAFKGATGHTLLITSGYRTYAQQKSLYDRWKAGTFKSPSVAPPGTSLHESGKALDIRDSGSSAGVTVAGNVRSNWIRKNAAKYGFLPNGYNFGEPWHVEYQGNPWTTEGSIPTKKPSSTNITKLQAAVRATQDNIVGPDTRKRVNAVRRASNWGGRRFPYGVKYTQRVVGAKDDGIWRQKSEAKHDETVRKIQAAVGVKQDSIWGPATEAAVKALGA